MVGDHRKLWICEKNKNKTKQNQKQEVRWTCTIENLCICIVCGFENSKVRIVRYKKNKDVGLVTTYRLSIMNETYEIEKEKKEVILIMT